MYGRKWLPSDMRRHETALKVWCSSEGTCSWGSTVTNTHSLIKLKKDKVIEARLFININESAESGASHWGGTPFIKMHKLLCPSLACGGPCPFFPWAGYSGIYILSYHLLCSNQHLLSLLPSLPSNEHWFAPFFLPLTLTRPGLVLFHLCLGDMTTCSYGWKNHRGWIKQLPLLSCSHVQSLTIQHGHSSCQPTSPFLAAALDQSLLWAENTNHHGLWGCRGEDWSTWAQARLFVTSEEEENAHAKQMMAMQWLQSSHDCTCCTWYLQFLLGTVLGKPFMIHLWSF